MFIQIIVWGFATTTACTLAKQLAVKRCVTCHLSEGGTLLFSHAARTRHRENWKWRIWIEINCLLQIKDVSLNGGRRPVNSRATRCTLPTPPFLSPRLIYISQWHIYIQREYEVTFCFTPVLTFNSKDNGQEGKAILRPILMCFNTQPS